MDEKILNLFNNKFSFEEHENRLDLGFRNILKEIRDFTNNLGDNVKEEIRPHRIVYSKGIVFRIFLDIEPAYDKIIITIKKGREKKERYVIQKLTENIEFIKKEINDAYINIQ
ncbi:MAG: hypothetical protein DA328_06395 [Nitrososphaeraceae archaeon]|nr:hypothetical protein [Nitrososphaeraceae archaeon]